MGVRAVMKGRVASLLTSAVLAGATAAVTYSVVDDILMFRQCSKEAIAIASSNRQLTEATGAPLRVSPWFAATLAISHGGRAATATVPVTGPQGSALLRVRVLRLKGGRSTLLYNMSSDAKWHVFALHADVAPAVQHNAGSDQVAPQDQSLHVQLLDILQPERQEEQKNEGNAGGSVCEPCQRQSQGKT